MSTPLYEKIFEAIKLIPEGRVASCQTIAKLAGNPKARHFVTRAFKSHGCFMTVPTHRVVNEDGRLIYKYPFGGTKKQAELLEKEGIKIEDGKVVDVKKLKFKVSQPIDL